MTTETGVLPTSEVAEKVWSYDDWRTVFGTSEWGSASTPEWSTTDVPAVSATPVPMEAVAQVEAWDVVSHQEYADQDIVALMRLHDGSYLTLVAWSDSSGFGCRDGIAWKVAPNRDVAIKRGLDKAGRRRLGLQLADERD